MRRNFRLLKEVVTSEALVVPTGAEHVATLPRLGGSVSDLGRYLVRDPHAFLIEDSRLSRSERVWQKVYIAVPITAYLVMLSLPVSIAYLATLNMASRKH